MNRARTPHDPLRGHNWRDGVEPPATQQQPVQQQQEPPEIEFDYDPSSKSNLMARKAAAIIRQKYRIEAGDVRAMGQHDREMRTTWQQLMAGTFTYPESVMTLIDPKEAAAARASDVRNPANWR